MMAYHGFACSSRDLSATSSHELTFISPGPSRHRSCRRCRRPLSRSRVHARDVPTSRDPREPAGWYRKCIPRLKSALPTGNAVFCNAHSFLDKNVDETESARAWEENQSREILLYSGKRQSALTAFLYSSAIKIYSLVVHILFKRYPMFIFVQKRIHNREMYSKRLEYRNLSENRRC